VLERTLDDDDLITATPNLVGLNMQPAGSLPAGTAEAAPARAATEFALAAVAQVQVGNPAAPSNHAHNPGAAAGQRVQLSAEESAMVQRAVEAAAAAPADLPLAQAELDSATFAPRHLEAESVGDAYLDSPAGVPRARSRTFWVVAVCFVMGIAGATLAAYQFGYLSRADAKQAASADALLTRANLALKDGQYTQPEASSVAALVREGAAKFPQDPRFSELRERCAEQLSNSAQSADARGDATAARGYALQAAAFSPLSDVVTKRLAKWLPSGDDLALPTAKPSASGSAAGANRPRAIAPGFALPATPGSVVGARANAGGSGTTGAGAVVNAAGAKGVLRVALARSVIEARPGQNVEFTATVAEDDHAPKTSAESAFFSFSGEGLSTRVAAQTDGLVYRSSLSFFQAGNYTVGFQATFAGKLAQGVATFHVAAPGEAPVQPRPPLTAASKPVPVPAVTPGVPNGPGTGAVKWM
jgi:hypothetical protein